MSPVNKIFNNAAAGITAEKIKIKMMNISGWIGDKSVLKLVFRTTNTTNTLKAIKKIAILMIIP